MDESGFFYRALPSKSLVEHTDDCKGGKLAKERLTVMFCCSMTGEKLQPLVVGKAERPRCFKNTNIAALGVTWKANKRAWVNSALFEDWLKKVDCDMRRQNRNILMFLDNAPCHPDLSDTCTNIKLQFFPPNTTAKLQPLDQGIIKNVKVKYRTKLLQHVISKVDSCDSASDVAKSVNVLNAVTWISQAWKEVEPTVITNCFRHGGIQAKQGVADQPDIQPVDLEAEEMLKVLVERVDSTCSAAEFISFDGDIMPFETLDGDWEEQLIQRALGAEDDPVEVDAVEEEDEDDVHQPNIKSFREAMNVMEDVTMFLALQSDSSELFGEAAQVLQRLKSKVAERVASARQSTLDDFFTKAAQQQSLSSSSKHPAATTTLPVPSASVSTRPSVTANTVPLSSSKRLVSSPASPVTPPATPAASSATR